MESSMTAPVYSRKTTDVAVDSKCSNYIRPKLRKNRRIENKWGSMYQVIVEDAVFGKYTPYMPTEPPASLSEEIVESDPLYVCKQCKDCFRFQSSFEDHNKRRSWILGLWCYNCFITVCTHVTATGSACPLCIKKDSDKRSYLRTRGLTKNHKLGVTRVFYNQCQFFEHVKMHGSSTVDMGDLTLMPLPANMHQSDWSPQVEIICEALMERTFLSRVHIMDWLKIYNLEDNWWKLSNGKSNNNVISKVVEGYQGRQLFKTFEESTEFMDLSFSDNVEFTDSSIKDKDANHYSVNKTADKNVSENEDNPCMSTDIAFVDCGPTSQYFEPELISYVPFRRRLTVVTKSAHSIKGSTAVIKINNKKKIATRKVLCSRKTDRTSGSNITVKADKSSNKNVINRQSSKHYVKQCRTAEPLVKKVAKNSINKPIIETDINKILDNSIKLPISSKKIPISGKKVLPKILPKTNPNHLEQGQTSNSNSKIRNVKSSRNSQNADRKIMLSKTNSDHSEQDQTSITNNNSKILNVQSTPNTDITSIIDQIPSPLISNKLIVIGQDSNNIITCEKNEVSTEKKSSILVFNNSNDIDNMSSQKKMCDSVSIEKQEKILIKNGKKYFIKHQKNVTKDIENPSNLPIKNSMTKTGKQLASEHNTSISNSSKAETNDVEQVALFSNDILILTPSPSPSESSSSSGWINESHIRKTSVTSKLRTAPSQAITVPSTSGTVQKKYLFETISLTEKNGDVYMDVKIVDRISKEGFRDTFEVIPKYREQMINDFHQLHSFELKERINHLQLVSEEMRAVLNFLSSNVLWEKSRSINTLQCILEKCLQKCNQDTTDKRNDDDDVMLTEWESKISETHLHKCPLCNKFTKPKSYIPGFSKLSKNENIYCSCYKLICHECQCYQETQSRFIAHQNYHKNCKPYVCPNCDSKFTSVRSLELHTWTVCFHTLKKFVISCKICEIDGFRDMESITRHIAIMHSTTKIACVECRKVFSSYSEYVKHSIETHPSILNQNPIRLVKCKLGNVIIRFENFMLYADMHPAIRKKIWFKCPFCSLITVENKHTTAILNDHLRNKHLHRMSEVVSKQALLDIFGTESLQADVNIVSATSVDTFTNEAANNTIIPKIVNARTISSEIFEHGTEDEVPLWKYVETNVAWSRIEIKPSAIEDVDDKQNIGLLPKILNVQSMNNSKSSTPKEALSKTSTEETKEKPNSQSPQAKIDEKDDPLAGENKKQMKLNDSKSDNKEEIEKTEEPDKTDNESLVSTDINDVCVNSSIASCEKNLESEFTFKSSTDGRIKVVDIRKICKPNIEPFVTAEPNGTSTEDENTSYMTSIPQPPPLAKIPQHLLESMKMDDNSKNVARTSKSFARRKINKMKERIAIHGTTDTQEVNVDYLCHLCGEQINTSTSVMQTHFQEKHSHECKLAIITPQLTRMSPDFINGGYKQFIDSKKRKVDSAFLVSKRKRRWTPKKHAEPKDANAPVGLCVEQETAEDGEGNFKCKKCDQRCTDMSDLREHIAANHRLKGRYLICLECGENFVVAPSLQMHLKAFHGIEDPINYMNQNPSYAPDIDGDSEAEGKTTVANQCYVCMAVFENKAAVDKHLRVHGMAFLNRKRIEARNALRSPEKKTNIEEDKQDVAKDAPKEIVKQDKPAEIILEKLNITI